MESKQIVGMNFFEKIFVEKFKLAIENLEKITDARQKQMLRERLIKINGDAQVDLSLPIELLARVDAVLADQQSIIAGDYPKDQKNSTEKEREIDEIYSATHVSEVKIGEQKTKVLFVTPPKENENNFSLKTMMIRDEVEKYTKNIANDSAFDSKQEQIQVSTLGNEKELYSAEKLLAAQGASASARKVGLWKNSIKKGVNIEELLSEQECIRPELLKKT